MASDPELLRLAQQEADAIVAEAREQAARLEEAANQRQLAADADVAKTQEAGRELARNLEQTIELLTQILTELRGQLGD